MLVLFDIDGTLVRTGGAGLRALLRAGRELHGPDFETHGVETAGRVDPAILRDLLERNGRGAGPGEARRLFERYAAVLLEVLQGSERAALPGVAELTQGVAGTPDMTAGLLTGNYEVTGRIKLEACGLEHGIFEVNAFADDCDPLRPERRQLPPAALRRCAELGRAARPERTVIVGDTPHDVDCAHAHGCLALAVATGGFDAETLAAAGADLVLADLGEVRDALDALRRLVEEPRLNAARRGRSDR